MKKHILIVGVIAALACGQHAPGSYEQGGRNYPIYNIGVACSNGTPDGQGCTDNFMCCSGICFFSGLTPGMGTCVECETDSQCPDPMTPICDTVINQCVSSAATTCQPIGGHCELASDCCSFFCDTTLSQCATMTKDSGGD
jgi:hypothetical protein